MSAAELRDCLDDEAVVILDARFNLDDEAWGDRVYAEAHIPGARRADLARHLGGRIVPGVTGRRPFPDPQDFAQDLGAWGIDDTTQVVVYDAEGGLMAAARAWLMVRWMGHDRVAVLDGGLPAWQAIDGPLTSEEPSPIATVFPIRLRPSLVVDAEEVDALRVREPIRVFDSRGEAIHRGLVPSHDPIDGHIAHTGLADRAHTLTSDARLRSPEDLRAHYGSLIGAVDPREVVFYCGSGVTAAQNVLAMEHAGLPGSRMYVGSWSEWITDPTRATER